MEKIIQFLLVMIFLFGLTLIGMIQSYSRLRNHFNNLSESYRCYREGCIDDFEKLRELNDRAIQLLKDPTEHFTVHVLFSKEEVSCVPPEKLDELVEMNVQEKLLEYIHRTKFEKEFDNDGHLRVHSSYQICDLKESEKVIKESKKFFDEKRRS